MKKNSDYILKIVLLANSMIETIEICKNMEILHDNPLIMPFMGKEYIIKKIILNDKEELYVEINNLPQNTMFPTTEEFIRRFIRGLGESISGAMENY